MAVIFSLECFISLASKSCIKALINKIVNLLLVYLGTFIHYCLGMTNTNNKLCPIKETILTMLFN